MQERLLVGDKAPALAARTINGRAVSIPDAEERSELPGRQGHQDRQGHQGNQWHSERLLHVQFRRFAGCPVCNFHLMTMARRHDEIAAAGVQSIVFFHSEAEEMRRYQSRLPFDCVADPRKQHYRAWGVETSWTALLHPRVLLNGARWVLMARRLYRKAENGILGLPADFLVDPRGTLLAVKYGVHADDQWSVDELLAIARGVRAAGTSREAQPHPGISAPASIARRATRRAADPEHGDLQRGRGHW